jgi:hypothetical protein
MNASDYVSIQVSDPWDVVTDLGDAPLVGRLCSLAANVAIVRLDLPLAVKGTEIAFINAKPRHASGEFMKAGGPVAANLTFLTTDRTPAFSAIGTLTRS